MTVCMTYGLEFLEREARALRSRMSVARAARMCGVSAGTVAAWADGRALTPAMARSLAIALACCSMGWVGIFGTIRLPAGVRVEAEGDSCGGIVVRVTQSKTDERGGA